MRKLKVAIVSDLHLGTYGSCAKEFTEYLTSIDPEILILNGDIVDMWQFKKSFFPSEHWDALKYIMTLAMNGTQIYYLTGNHDDALRRFSDFSIGNFQLCDKLTLDVDGKKYWIFHGDVFDASVNHSQWIAKLGGRAYDWLIRLNRAINQLRLRFNMSPLSFSKKIKANIKNAAKFIGSFEETAINLAMDNRYDYVVCGHIHQPKMKTIEKNGHKLTYMNSGDWVENLTSLEYTNGLWAIYHHNDTATHPKVKK